MYFEIMQYWLGFCEKTFLVFSDFLSREKLTLEPSPSSQWSLVRCFKQDIIHFSFVRLNHLSKRAKSNKIDAKEVLHKASYEAPLTRKTRLLAGH